MKDVFTNKYFKNILIIIFMFLSLYLPDLFLRIFSNSYIDFYNYYEVSPNYFTISWCALIILLLNLLPKKPKMVIYSILVIAFNIIVYSQHIHFLTLDRFYGFSDILLLSNATGYITSVLKNSSILILLSIIISLCFAILTVILIKKTEKIKYGFINCLLLLLFLGLRFSGIYLLGEEMNTLTWEDNNNVKNIYTNYANYNKSLEVSGIYEYVFRSTYLYFNNNKINENEILTELDNYFLANNKTITTNEYTNIFKDKNVIYILMESIDSWLITEEIMPTLYKLQNEGLNFTNKYTPTYGGGQTINSEFAMHTGLYAINSGKAIYNYSNNNFKTSLANSFKNNGYVTTSVHANEGDFYNRIQFHKALGFNNSYFLNDMSNIDKSYNYFADSNIIKNDETFNLMISEDKFLTFLITYSAHLPYNFSNELCKNNPYNLNVSDDESLSCIRNLAKETDEMLRLLIERLEEKQILDNTVLVLVTDHYTYGYDEEYVEYIKNTDNKYLLQNTPFIIWNNNIEAKSIDLMVDTADILPTIFNMFGIKYNPNYYSGEDIFASNRDNFVYFENNVFYDGDIFYDESYIPYNNEIYINDTLLKIKDKININDKIIISDYFKNVQRRGEKNEF